MITDHIAVAVPKSRMMYPSGRLPPALPADDIKFGVRLEVTGAR